MQGAVVGPAERHGELVAHLAAERARLHEAEVVGVGGLAGADQAGLLRDEPQVLLVAVAARCGDGQHALVDAGRLIVFGAISISGGFVLRWGRGLACCSIEAVCRRDGVRRIELGKSSLKRVLDKLGIVRREAVLGRQNGARPVGGAVCRLQDF